jgi:hypothetical protein
VLASASAEPVTTPARAAALPVAAARPVARSAPPPPRPAAQALAQEPGIAVARAAAAVMVEDALPSLPRDATGIEMAILFEVRAALRGTSHDDLVSAVGAPASAVAAALDALRSRGALVQRGARWFTA